MDKKIILTLVIIIVLVLFILTQFKEDKITGFVTEKTIKTEEDLLFEYEIVRYPSSAQIIIPEMSNGTLQLGISLDPANLSFGIIPGNGSSSRRFINLTNTIEKEVKISIKAYGTIAPHVNFSMNNFILKPGENVIITTHFYTANAELGNYSGEVDLTVQIPKYDFIYLFWGS